MSEMPEIAWCFFHQDTGKTMLGLTENEARAVVMVIGIEDPKWLVWRTPWEEWRRLDRIYELHEGHNRILNEQPPTLPAAGDVEIGFTGPDSDGPQGLVAGEGTFGGKGDEPILQLENISFEDGADTNPFVVRKARRFSKRYEIAIHAENKVFNTFSVDISVGGIRLENEMPDWIKGYFKVRIKKPGVKQIIELSACLVEASGTIDRHRVNILPLQNSADESNLENWLAA